MRVRVAKPSAKRVRHPLPPLSHDIVPSSIPRSQFSEKLGAGVLVRFPRRWRDGPGGLDRVAHPRLHLPAVQEILQVVFKIVHVA